MAANISLAKRAGQISAAPVEWFVGSTLDLTCGCGASGRQSLAGYKGGTLGAVVQRMRCPDCGKPPAEVVLRGEEGAVALAGRGVV